MNNIALHLYMVNTVIINNTVYEIDHECNVHAQLYTATANECYNWYIVNVLMK